MKEENEDETLHSPRARGKSSDSSLAALHFTLRPDVEPIFFLSAALLFSPAILAEDEPADPIRIAGSSIVAKPLTLAAPVLHEHGFLVKVGSTEIGSGGVIAAVAENKLDIGLTTRPIGGEDRARYPERLLHEKAFAIQALALIVPKDVWEGGVRALDWKQLRGIYERQITNWKEVGGSDQAIKFYNPVQGHGVWEFFAVWLYGEQRKAPLGESFDPVADSEEARNSVEFNAGALTLAPPNVVDHRTTFALSLRDEKGDAVEPTTQNIRSGRYPLQRTLFMVTGDRPTGDLRKIIEFMAGPAGQAFVEKSELVSLEQP